VFPVSEPGSVTLKPRRKTRAFLELPWWLVVVRAQDLSALTVKLKSFLRQLLQSSGDQT
jgi:hypothetical protein